MGGPNLWVVEIAWDDAWRPTVGVRLDREGGRSELERWRLNNPGIPRGHFRLVKYTRNGGSR